MESLLGKILQDHYYITRQLAQKNYWTIYLAEDRNASSEKFYMIKRLQTQTEAQVLTSQAWQDLQEILVLELMHLKQVDHHPQIPEIIDFFTVKQDFFFVREFIPGETLAEEIAHRTLTEAEVISLLQESLKCLDFLHQNKILHLNLKPSNIIRREEDRRIFLTDFGSFNKLAENNNLQSQFFTSQYLEDREFTAPEYLQNKPVVASDIYALGKIVIYALSGKKGNKVEIDNLDNYARSVIKDLNNYQEISISSKLANILNKMTCDRALDRYQSAIEVLQDLQEKENVVVFPPPFDLETSEVEDILEVKPDPIAQKSQKKSGLKFLNFKLGRILVIPLVLIIILIVILVKNANKYRNFVEYNNERYNISFKYPQDWSLREVEDPFTGEVAVLSAPLEDGFDLFQEKIYLSIDELPAEVDSLDLYSQTIIKKIQSQLTPNSIMYEGNIKKLDDNQARSLIYIRQEGAKSLQQMEIFTVKENRAYVFTYIAEDIKYQEFLKITKKILESLEIKEVEQEGDR